MLLLVAALNYIAPTRAYIIVLPILRHNRVKYTIMNDMKIILGAPTHCSMQPSNGHESKYEGVSVSAEMQTPGTKSPYDHCHSVATNSSVISVTTCIRFNLGA